MKLVLVWELLSLAFIVRYCAASDPKPNRTPDSDTTSISISLPEEISKGNPISAITDAANFQQEKPSPDYPFDIVENFGLHSQSKSDPCLSDKNPAPSRRRRLRQQYCSSQFISPDRARKNPVTLPPMRKTWRNDLNIPAANQVPWSGGIIDDRNVCSDEWHNMPACAPESSAIGDYLPSCRPRTYRLLYSTSKRTLLCKVEKNCCPS